MSVPSNSRSNHAKRQYTITDESKEYIYSLTHIVLEGHRKESEITKESNLYKTTLANYLIMKKCILKNLQKNLDIQKNQLSFAVY